MKMINQVIIYFSIICFGSVIHPQEKSISLNELKWLSGHWKGEAFGGVAEEIWSEPSSNTMMGMFRLQYDNVDKLFEFLLIEQSESGITMKFKHIKPGYKEMEEEPIHLSLRSLDLSHAHFESDDKNLTINYKLLSENNIEIELTSIKNNKAEVTLISMTKN